MAQFDFTIAVKSEKSLSFQYNDYRGRPQDRAGKLISDPIAQFTVKRMNEWINIGLSMQANNYDFTFSQDDWKAIGLNLYRILFGDPEIETRFRDLYDDFVTDRRDGKYSGDSRMRLRLVFSKSTARLGELPWELLFLPDRNLAEDSGREETGKDELMPGFFFGSKEELLLTRYSAIASPDRFEIGEQPLKILLAVYTGFPNLNAIGGLEIGRVQKQMSLIPQAEIQYVSRLSTLELSDRLKEFRPHIFHFIGHGDAGKLSIAKSKEEEDWDETVKRQEDPQVKWIEASDFQNLFNYPLSPRLVFLQACNGSATPANSLGCAQELIKKIPAVIAMQHSIKATDAATFAEAFYKKLGKGADIDEAVRAGRQKLGEIGNPNWNHPRFGTPVVYLQTYDRLVAAQKTEPAGKEPIEIPPLTPSSAFKSSTTTATPSAKAATPAAAEEPAEQSSRFEPSRSA